MADHDPTIALTTTLDRVLDGKRNAILEFLEWLQKHPTAIGVRLVCDTFDGDNEDLLALFEEEAWS